MSHQSKVIVLLTYQPAETECDAKSGDQSSSEAREIGTSTECDANQSPEAIECDAAKFSVISTIVALGLSNGDPIPLNIPMTILKKVVNAEEHLINQNFGDDEEAVFKALEYLGGDVEIIDKLAFFIANKIARGTTYSNLNPMLLSIVEAQYNCHQHQRLLGDSICVNNIVKLPFDESDLNKAIMSDHLKCVQYLIKKHYPFCSETRRTDELVYTLEYAAECGRLEIIKYLLPLFQCCTMVVDAAAKNGHLDVIKYLNSRGYTSSRDSMDYAARGGYLAIIIYLKSCGLNWWSSTMYEAYTNRRLDVLKYLCDNECPFEYPGLPDSYLKILNGAGA